jgi:hypothetical protein
MSAQRQGVAHWTGACITARPHPDPDYHPRHLTRSKTMVEPIWMRVSCAHLRTEPMLLNRGQCRMSSTFSVAATVLLNAGKG